jgi:RNA polymerase sigma-32 factor
VAYVAVKAEGHSPSRYLDEISRFPMPSLEEEQTLARRWRDQQDVAAAHKLVTSHLRLVAKIAIGYRGYGLAVGDLISEGSIGMMQAVKRFDPDLGFRLATYAIWWIRAAIQEYILRSCSPVKIGTTTSQKKMFFNLRRLKGQMQAIDDGDMQPQQVGSIARTLDVPEADVVSINRRMAAPDHSLNAPLYSDSVGEWQDCLHDEAASQEIALEELQELRRRKALLPGALRMLAERERHIVVERRLKDDPTIAATLPVSAQHMRARTFSAVRWCASLAAKEGHYG